MRGNWAYYAMPPAASITYSKMSPALCADHDYLQMRFQRMSLSAREGWDGGAGEIKKYCDEILK
jgi:hypothetical protein